MSSTHKHTNRVNHIVADKIFSVIYCRIGIFYFLPVPSILVPRWEQRDEGSGKCFHLSCTCAARSLWSSYLKRQTRSRRVGRPNHSEDSHCYFAKSVEIWLLLWAKVISQVCNHKIFLLILRPPGAGIQLAPVFPIRWFQPEQMLVLVNMDILSRRILN